MSTHLPGFRSFFFQLFSHYFVLIKLATSSIRVRFFSPLFQLRSDMKSLTLRHKQEIRDIEKQAAESRARSQDSEASLRDEIKSLKHIISDLENRLGTVHEYSTS